MDYRKFSCLLANFKVCGDYNICGSQKHSIFTLKSVRLKTVRMLLLWFGKTE